MSFLGVLNLVICNIRIIYLVYFYIVIFMELNEQYIIKSCINYSNYEIIFFKKNNDLNYEV